MTAETRHKDDDMAHVRASIDKLSSDVASLSQSLANVLKSQTGQAAAGMRDGIKTAASEIGEKTRDSKDAIERTIRERPFQSLLAAFGTGLMIAQLFRKHGSS